MYILSFYILPSLYICVLYYIQLSDILTIPVRELFIPDLQRTVFDFLLNLTEVELRPLEKNDFEEIVRYFQIILERVPSLDKVVHECIEKFCLAFALKCFKSALLPKRLNGLSYIEEMIEAAQNRDHYPYMHMDDYSSGGFAIRSSKYIDLKYVATSFSFRYLYSLR